MITAAVVVDTDVFSFLYKRDTRGALYCRISVAVGGG